jgi:predicted GNAT superfamily acetyltransferase
MSGDQTSQTHNVHIIVLHSLMRGEGIRNQRRPYADYFIGRNASPYAAAANGYSAIICIFNSNPPWSAAMPIRIIIPFHSGHFFGCTEVK